MTTGTDKSNNVTSLHFEMMQELYLLRSDLRAFFVELIVENAKTKRGIMNWVFGVNIAQAVVTTLLFSRL